MGSIEKRVHARYDIEHAIDVTRGDTTTSGRMVNLSRGGTRVAVSFQPPLKMSERVELEFRVPDHETPLRCRAEVRWIDPVDRSMIGLQFVTGFRARETWALGRFLERVEAGEVG
jgi:hypothetical protein